MPCCHITDNLTFRTNEHASFAPINIAYPNILVHLHCRKTLSYDQINFNIFITFQTETNMLCYILFMIFRKEFAEAFWILLQGDFFRCWCLRTLSQVSHNRKQILSMLIRNFWKLPKRYLKNFNKRFSELYFVSFELTQL